MDIANTLGNTHGKCGFHGNGAVDNEESPNPPKQETIPPLEGGKKGCVHNGGIMARMLSVLEGSIRMTNEANEHNSRLLRSCVFLVILSSILAMALASAITAWLVHG